MKARNVLALLLVLVLCAALLAGCGGGKKQEDDAAKAESEFLMGMWFAKEASYNGETADPEDIFEGTFSLYFSDNGECTMAIDQNRAVVKWELTDDGVTLTGDNTYAITFPDASKKTLVIDVNGVDVLMEKYED